MRKTTKKIIAAVMSVLLVGSAFAGCSGSGKTEKTGDPNVIKIGGIGPTTGDNAIYGNAVKNGAQLAVDEINAAGGINGMKIEFSFEDDVSNEEKAVNAYNKLKDWGMQILMGTTTSSPCIAVAGKTEKDNMFQLTPSGSAVDCAKPENVFRVCFSDPGQGTASARYIGENKLAKKVGIIFDSSDVYSTGIKTAFVLEAKNQGFEVVAENDGAFTSENATDFTTQLKKLQSAGAELVFLPIYYTEAALILKQASTMNFKPKFFGCDGLDGILTVDKFDKSLAEGVMLLTPFAADASDEKTQTFVSKYQEKFGNIPNQFAADAYDAIYIIKAAAEKAGIKGDMTVSDICDKMKAAMTSLEPFNGLTGQNITWAASGDPNKDPKAVVINGGKYHAMNQ